MTAVFPLTVSYGARVSLKFPHELKQTVQGYDFLNAQNSRPLLEFDISRNLMYGVDKDAVLALFESVQGSQDYLLFEDFSDYKATKNEQGYGKPEYPLSGGYDRGITQGMTVRDIDGNLRLVKRYRIANSQVYRVITHPNQVQVYRGANPVSVSIEQGTGIITGGQDGDTWEGTFYVPVRFVDDDFSYTKVGNFQYAFNSLKLREVKIPYGRINGEIISRTVNSLFSLLFNFNSESTKKFKTIVTSFDNDYEEREQQYDFLEQRYILTRRKLLDEADIQYLVTLFRCFLGSFTVFKFKQFDDEGVLDVCLESPLEITASMKKNDFNKALYEVNNLILKTTRLDEINKLRTMLCKTWKIVAKDETEYKTTDYDQDLEMGIDDRFSAVNSLKGFATSFSNNFEIDNTETEGIFKINWIDEEDVIAGKFEDAKISINLVDWYNQTVFKNLFNGYIGNQTVSYSKNGGREFKFEGLSLIRDLSKNNSNVTSSRCRHKFLEQGYGKCDRDFTVETSPSSGSVRVRTILSGVTNNTTIQAGTPSDNFAGYNFGTVLFETGKLKGVEIFIADASGTTINLMFGMKVLPEIGDQVLITRNCDKSIQACQSYGNTENFGGFPRMPGFDGVIRIADTEG